jgi:hypothetical protein
MKLQCVELAFFFPTIWKDDVIDLTQSPRSKDDEVEIIKSHSAMSNLIVGRPPLEVQVTEKAISVRILLSQNLLPKSKTQARGDINFRDTRTQKRPKKKVF